jgi:hypothetical protein
MCNGPEKSPIKFPAVPPRTQQLNSVNERIAKLAHANPQSNIYGVFVLTGRLARMAVDTALELKKLPGVNVGEIEPVLNFWYRLSDYARTAALNCAGGNQTLAEALITYQFLQTAAAEDETTRS